MGRTAFLNYAFGDTSRPIIVLSHPAPSLIRTGPRKRPLSPAEEPMGGGRRDGKAPAGALEGGNAACPGRGGPPRKPQSGRGPIAPLPATRTLSQPPSVSRRGKGETRNSDRFLGASPSIGAMGEPARRFLGLGSRGGLRTPEGTPRAGTSTGHDLLKSGEEPY